MQKCLLFFLSVFCLLNQNTANYNIQQTSTNDLAYESGNRLLVFATLSGNLVAIEEQTGRKLWSIVDKPIVQVPVDTTNAITPIFLPDPRDGSLYLLGGGKEPLRKLPFTIPQLVANSPCRSSDGVLYTGKKKDTWFRLDPATGRKEQVLGWDTSGSTCPLEAAGTVFFGRTKYDLLMVDSLNPLKKWRVTYYDYTATTMSRDQLERYDLAHFASSSTGRLMTMDRRRGAILWDGDLGSPVVAAYVLHADGLLAVPFTTLANHTLNYLTSIQRPEPHRMRLYPTLYVGDHPHGLYALPSLVDQNVVTITASDEGPLLLGGPHAPGPHAPVMPRPYPEYPVPGSNYRLPSNLYNEDSITFQSLSHIIYMGHYNLPKYVDQTYLLGGKMLKEINLISSLENDTPPIPKPAPITPPPTIIKKPTKSTKTNQIIHHNLTLIDFLKAPGKALLKTNELIRYWLNHQENKGLKLTLIILVGCVIAMFWHLQVQVREFQHLSQNGSKSSQQSTALPNSPITAHTEELSDGFVRIGKIIFHPAKPLGKGCEGTFVYRGEFDSRKVAVKRLLPECFTFADREVALLRESDAHPNVIRYYCMEQDRLFRYIALELCQATVNDYVMGRCDRDLIRPLAILRQATAGLEHLHLLDIVHRDIKPHNVLLSMANSQGQVKAMISDFGLCKKLQMGKVSFSRRSGVTGTDGWIAPEMLNSSERTTCAVDLFSLGCLFFYVLSDGCHPFGDALRRQANILTGESNLDELKGETWEKVLQKPLLAAMISNKPKERPSCSAILTHPIFWDNAKILAFFQDVSDRVEKAEPEDQVLQALEKNNRAVVRGDWRAHIHESVVNDIKKYRSYRGDSVRDLLRALRNKKHHFRELDKEAQQALGDVPDSFTLYFTARFPLLLVHVWLTMQCVRKEAAFRHYYPKKFAFSYAKFERVVAIEGGDEEWKMVAPLPASPAVKQKRRKTVGAVEELAKGGVGLYRNLTVDDGQKRLGNKSRPKRASKRDEPLLWAVSDR